MNPSQLQNHFDAFYEDFWCEMCKYGEIEEVVVCDNNNDRKQPPATNLFFFSRRQMLTTAVNRFNRKRLRSV